MRNLTIALLVFFTMSLTVCPSHHTIRFQRISLEQGLSQSIVPCILQDSRGFMWFGTEDGLNKYDGYRFSVKKQIPGDANSLSHNNILALYEDKTGILWIGTHGGGLNKFDRKNNRYTHYLADSRKSDSLSNNKVNCILEDRAGNLWLGTDAGLNKFDRQKETFTVYQKDPANPTGLSHNSVLTLFEDRSGAIWVGTNGGGLDQFDPETGVFTAYQNQPGDPDSLSHNLVRCIQEDLSGVLWIGTGGGLNKFDRRREVFTTYQHFENIPDSISNNDIYAIYQDRFGHFLIGTDDGLNLFDPKAGTFHRYVSDANDSDSISNNGIRSIYEDQSGVVWIGTYGGGINKFDGQKQKFIHYYSQPDDPGSLSHNIVWSIYEDNEGYLWIGTHGGGLNKFDRKNNRFIHYRADAGKSNSLSSDSVRLVFEDHTGILWLGTNGGGLNAFNRKSGTFKWYKNEPDNPDSLSHNELRSIYEDRAGVLWIGTNGGGLNRFNREKETFKRYQNDPNNPLSLSNNFVRAIYEDRQGNFWIGTQGGGLNLFNRETESFANFKHDPENSYSLSNDFVFALYEDTAENFWIGTWGGGLNRFDRQKQQFYCYRMSDGLPNDSVYGILEDNDGNLWLSTNMGLSRFNPRATAKGEQFKNYTESDGLQSNEFNGGSCFKSKSGEMFFGGIKGFNAFFPEQIRDSDYIPPIVITSFRKLNREINLPQPISETNVLNLTYKDYFFSFEFAALDYAAPQKNLYAYKMEGLDQDWIYTDADNRLASYTTLPPGDYTFRVKGTNSDGKWNEAGAEIKLFITPPIWGAWWFKSLGVALFLMVIFYLHRRRTGRIKQEMEKKRLEEELRLKADFTAMLVHDLRSPLTAVMGYSDMLKDKAALINIAKVAAIISRSSEKMLNLINDMLDVSKFEAGKMTLNLKNTNIDGIITDMVEIMNPLFQKKNITLEYRVSPEAKKRKLYFDPEKIGQVLNNLLSNAVKFSPENNTVIIDVSKSTKELLEVAVIDNGPGVDPDRQRYLFDKYAQLNTNVSTKGTGLGLAVSKMIIESHGGSIGYKAAEQGGSIFFFCLPFSSKSA